VKRGENYSSNPHLNPNINPNYNLNPNLNPITLTETKSIVKTRFRFTVSNWIPNWKGRLTDKEVECIAFISSIIAFAYWFCCIAALRSDHKKNKRVP